MKQAEVWIWPEGCSLLTPAYINGQDRYCELCTWFNSYKNRKESEIKKKHRRCRADTGEKKSTG